MRKTLLFVCLIGAFGLGYTHAFQNKSDSPRAAFQQKSSVKRLVETAQTKVRQDESWLTPSEATDYRTTPRYEETLAYLYRISAAAPNQVRTEIFGKTGEGHDLVAVIVSRDGLFDPAALHRANRPIVLIQNAIHAGEMDGKDACLAILRDILITGSQAALIERAVVVIIPIYNVDGHERFGAYKRINQNGPGQTGWRTTARNLDLNRDYLKADAPETRAFLRLWNKWLPDYFIDNHVTDGADYQYDTTYLLSTGPDVFLALNDWQRNVVAPYLERSVTETGHLISPFAYFNDPTDPAKGMFTPGNMPRFSTGYAILQNRPSMLVEMHMLKDYKTRVTGNYDTLRAVLKVINRDADLLTKMNREADAATIAAGRSHNTTACLPLWTAASSSTVPFRFRGYKTKRSLSEISGAIRIEYTKEPLEITIPWQNNLEATRSVTPPRAYIVPAQWTQVVEVLEAHGLQVLRTARQWFVEVEAYRCSQPKWQEKPYEGRHQLVWPRVGRPNGASEPACILVREKMSFPTGSAVVLLDQRAAKVAVHFLEPEAPDSAVAWGFFDAVFEQKEYAEIYILEGLSREMLDKDPQLREEFEKRLTADHEFASNPAARLNFFYQRSPWWDSRIGLYPVGRLTTLEGVPLAR